MRRHSRASVNGKILGLESKYISNNLFAKLQKQNVADCDGSRAKESVQQWPPLYRVQPGPGWQDGESDIVIFNLNTGHMKSYNTINDFL